MSKKNQNRCSFCGKSKEDVQILISGLDGFICENCVSQAKEIVEAEVAHTVNKPSNISTPTKNLKPKSIKEYLDKYVIGQDEAKKVIAVDIEKELVDMMIAEKSYYKQEIQNKFEARLAQADNPNLEDNEIDIAFIANTYPYISNRIQYLKKLRSKFKANGKIMIVDFKKKLTPIGPSQEERLAQSEVEQELIDAGYQLIISDDTTLQYQYIIVAKI